MRELHPRQVALLSEGPEGPLRFDWQARTLPSKVQLLRCDRQQISPQTIAARTLGRVFRYP
jgi:hypothetical protein